MARTKRVRAGRPSIVSDEVRRKLFKKHFDEGYSAEDIFRNNKDTIGRRTAYRLVADFKQNYDWRRVSRPQRVRASAHEWFLTILKQVIDARPSAYLDEIKRVLRVQYRTSLSTSSICRYVHAPAPRGLGYSLLVLERRAINKDYSERQRFLQMMASGQFPPEQLIFVDECHKSRHEARRRRGYGFRGQRIQLHEPFQDDSNFTLLAAFNANGFVVPACLITPATVDTAAWTAWAHACLCPVLGDYSKGEPNSVLVLDNVNQHWSADALRFISDPVSQGGRGTQIIFLPPYSPEFNPIELGFGWLKKYIRRHFEDLGGNSKAVEKAVYQGIRELTRDTAAGFFRKSGYFIKHVDEDAVLVVAASVVAVMVTLL